ncbi:MAG: alpha-L-fucosidase [Victivallales bacterium]|nr:alpha-L-fucosidase [Victivallales bacterium]
MNSVSDLTASKRHFREARLGAFIHWGLYANPGGVWEGTSVPYLAEWLQSARRIPNAEYSRLAEQFNPQGFDADAIVKAFSDAGMRYIVFTAKHHEGFAMWRSHVSPFNSYDATPAHRDFVDEWSHACQKHGVKLGLYYSHCLDWHEPDGGDPRPCADNFGMSWGNDWDFPDQQSKNFDRYFEGKVLPQLTELLSNYGEVAVLWLDCPMTVITPHHARRILELVHTLQPNCLVNSRLCMLETLGDYGSLGDNQLPAGTTADDFPREAIITLNDSWGYKSTDHNWKSPAQVRKITLDALQSGANLLVNFGPDGEGRLTPESWAVLHDLAKWQAAVGEALHSGGQSPFPQDLGWANAVAAGQKLWIFPHAETPQSATLAGVSGELQNACGGEVQRLSDDTWQLAGLERLAKTQTPLRMEFSAPPHYDTCPRIQNGRMSLLPAQARLVHGKANASTALADAPLGAAGEKLIGNGHSVLADNGALCDWQNPAERCVWHLRLESGRYRLRLVTRNGAHSQPWHGDRTVEVTIGDRQLTANLVATEELDDSHYYRAAITDLGEISIVHGGELDLTIRTIHIASPDAATMQLERLELQRS